jgi:predicted RNA-binding Zn ribbon-like protein
MDTHDAVANARCLELTNTINNRFAVTRDLLDSAETFRAWALAAGMPVTGAVDAAFLAEARERRELIHRVFGALADGATPDADDLARLHAAWLEGVARTAMERRGDRYVRVWPEPRTPARLLAEVADSAIDLLTSGPLGRIRRCPSCGWLFLDTSRNGRRRWCSMSVCGNRVKASRYYATHRQP